MNELQYSICHGLHYKRCYAAGSTAHAHGHASSASRPRVAVVQVQMLSVFSCGFTLLGSPLIVQMGNATASMGGKAAIAVGLCSFGAFTTGMSAPGPLQ